MKHVLSIAGSDSGGGAGIQADIKTMSALGVYAMTVITAVTAQNTQAVYQVQELDVPIVVAQIEAVYRDIPVDAVKIGMVSNAAIIHGIKASLLSFHAKNIVVDPVMVSKTGYQLLRSDAIEALKTLAMIADIFTPNIPEAELLCGTSITTEADMRQAAETIAALGVRNVLIKGGHRAGPDAGDLLFLDGRFVALSARRIETKHTHGTGCTLSSAIASRLALGDSMEAAVRTAKAYLTQAIADSYALGKGTGPVGHFAALYRKAGMETVQ
ncbi:MAG: bifunctional hydroxymethylpyrimidine kinase/phosphomethylpyrimidine kinase [Treponema sp.]|jgi:hydroxymethylpyrimidine/phosphomethylpyrimidine kinase|nr:bifunctional hydroxymethylpyrimidine kinase/phosphomethylpyrimidine kinase [Treponema sp.]